MYLVVYVYVQKWSALLTGRFSCAFSHSSSNPTLRFHNITTKQKPPIALENLEQRELTLATTVEEDETSFPFLFQLLPS